MIEPHAPQIRRCMRSQQTRLPGQLIQLNPQLIGRAMRGVSWVFFIRNDLISHETFDPLFQGGLFGCHVKGNHRSSLSMSVETATGNLQRNVQQPPGQVVEVGEIGIVRAAGLVTSV